MKNSNNKHHGIALILLVALFFYFGNGAMAGAKINSGINENGWMWFPTVISLIYGITLILMIFRNNKKQCQVLVKY